ncbi:copper oxidase [Demequina litorisediminis]|uniref:EfeO-type cupredoxin-like domain-containing protein n=1 Tax=Demequina litorisediminis TaxID=1849022 RepID=A0ABQ6IBC5_9MICO|nr:copper oxidase [Demequina litorisediminis]GMA34053.1 hypothetical protein GCM10025876_02570 [Demequina litorisediminis]
MTKAETAPAAPLSARARWHLRAHVLVAAWLVGAAVVAVGHRAWSASPWLMVHLLMLGAVTTAILIWSAHFTEALRRRPLPGGQRAQAVRLAAHTVGAITVMVGVVGSVTPCIVVGASIVGSVAVWHAAAIALASRGALGNMLGWTTWAYVASAILLACGVIAGALLADGAADAQTAARLYVAHVSAMVVGWVTVTVLATLLTLWPTMIAVRVPQGAVRWSRTGLSVLAASVMVTWTGALTDLRALAAAGAAAAALGVILATVPVVMVLRTRAPGHPSALILAAGLFWLDGAVLGWAWALVTGPTWEDAQHGLDGLVPALVAGGVAQVLLGALSHLLPMVMGGGPHAVRSARDASERHGTARLVLANGGLALWIFADASLLRVVGSVLALAVALWTVGCVLRAIRVSWSARRHVPEGPTVVSAADLAVRPRAFDPFGGAVAAGVVAVVVAGAVAADPQAVGLGMGADAGVTATGTTVEVTIEAADMRFSDDLIEVSAGDRVLLTVVNTDPEVEHDLVLDSGQTSGRLAPGEQATIDVGVVGRDIDGWCSIAGHRQMGMTLTIDVDDAAGALPQASAEATAGDSATDDMAGMDGMSHGVDDATGNPADAIDLSAPMSGDAVDATLAPEDGTSHHEVTLVVTDETIEVAPGYTQEPVDLWGRRPRARPARHRGRHVHGDPGQQRHHGSLDRLPCRQDRAR